KSAAIDVPASGLTFVVGPNNAGKSALLLAVDRLMRIGEFYASDVRIGSTVARIVATFILSDSDREAAIRRLGTPEPLVPAWLATTVLKRVRWTFVSATNRFALSSLDVEDSTGAVRPVAWASGDGTDFVPIQDRLRLPVAVKPFEGSGHSGTELHTWIF